MKYRATIGLEIHIQLKTKTKLFCSCPSQPSQDPNTQICEVCLGYPGALPILNRAAIEQGITIASALGMQIAREVRFDRKHYVYPDLAKSFQTSQFYSTIARGGDVKFEVRDRQITVHLREAHLEEDAAKLEHTPYESKIDFNRGGTPLLEVVTEPDLHFGEEAEALLRYIQLLVRTIGASDANPEMGQLRCDVNISVSKDEGTLGTRVEIKNLNSPRFVRLAIDAEFDRQVGLLESGHAVVRETRGWNENRGVTEGQRAKELALDYRYLAEPDLPVVVLDDRGISCISASIAELPSVRAARFVNDFGLSRQTAGDLVANPAAADYFESCVEICGEGELAASWTLNQVREIENRMNSPFSEPQVKPERLAELIVLLRDEEISTSNAKKLLHLLAETGKTTSQLLNDHNLRQESDPDVIRQWVLKTIGDSPDAVTSLEDGKAQSFQFLVGQVMRLSGGAANPQIVRQALQSSLNLKRIAVVGMGGAITATRGIEGALTSSTEANLESLLNSIRGSYQTLRIEGYPVSRELSENLTPGDWFSLWATLKQILDDNTHHGIVVTHGLDTLVFTASLMRWLLPSCPIPIVFTGARRGLEDEDTDARINAARAAELVSEGLSPGFWVSIGTRVLPACNLRMVSLDSECFEIFNVEELAEPGLRQLARGIWPAVEVTLDLLEKAVRSILMVKIYPGFDPTWILSSVHNGVRYVILELFESGTGNARWGVKESLVPVVKAIEQTGGIVFCTSQLALPVNLGEFETSQDLWASGVVPLGRLVTESAFTKLIAAQLTATSRDDLMRLMASQEFSL